MEYTKKSFWKFGLNPITMLKTDHYNALEHYKKNKNNKKELRLNKLNK